MRGKVNMLKARMRSNMILVIDKVHGLCSRDARFPPTPRHDGSVRRHPAARG